VIKEGRIRVPTTERRGLSIRKSITLKIDLLVDRGGETLRWLNTTSEEIKEVVALVLQINNIRMRRK